MEFANQVDPKQISQLKDKIENDLNPDLRDLTTHCAVLQLAKHETFQPPEAGNWSLEGPAQALASFTDQTLARGIAQIFAYKEIDAPLASTKATSLLAMSKIISSLATKALERSRSTGHYVHLTHIFYEDFGPSAVVPKSTFYGYKSAVTRYALKQVADLLPHMPSNVDKEEVEAGFLSLMSPSRAPTPPYPSNVDNRRVDTRVANVDNLQPHRLTQILMDLARHEIVEDDPKLAAYPWFAKRRQRTANGILPMLTKAEVVELAECVRFVCHYPPDLKFERRGLAGKKKTREFAFGELLSDGLLLNAPKPQFSTSKSSKEAFDRADKETKTEIGKRNKRLASTAFQPSHFWLDVDRRVRDQATKEAIATQLITGCRPSELVEGVIVGVQPTDEPESLGRLHFTIFGAKTKAPTVDPNIERTKQVENYLQFLETSSLAKNSKIRGQFFHTESHEVFPQFAERVWLYNLLADRSPADADRDSYSAITLLLEKDALFRKLPRVEALQPEIIELSSNDQRLIAQQLRERTGKTEISTEDIWEEVNRRNEIAGGADRRTRTSPSSTSEDFQAYVRSEIQKIQAAERAGDVRLVSPYQSARVVRFSFLPLQASFPLMSAFDGIAFTSSNVDTVGEATALPRIFLRNEFSEADLDLIGVPEEERHMLYDREYALLQKERAAYSVTAVIQLGKRYKSAAVGGLVEPTPYTARHRLLSDIKGLTDEDGFPILSKEDIARKAGHASTSSQTGYGKAIFSEKGSGNRAKGLKDIKSASAVKNPKATAGKRRIVASQPSAPPPEPRYEPRE